MDESAQQAISLGVNLVIFVAALTISIALMMNVKDISELAFDYDASMPTGSRVVETDEINRRIVSGHELISYYANYMTNINNQEIDAEPGNINNNKIRVVIEGTSGKIDTINAKPDSQELKTFLINKGNLDSDYEVIVTDYDNENEKITITIKQI